MPGLPKGVIRRIEQGDNSARDIRHIGEFVLPIRRDHQRCRLAPGEGTKCQIAQMRNWPGTGTIEIRRPECGEMHLVTSSHPHPGNVGTNGGLLAVIGQGHVFAQRLALRSVHVEIVHEHHPGAGCFCCVKNVGHGPWPDVAPDLAIVLKPDAQDDLTGSLARGQNGG